MNSHRRRRGIVSIILAGLAMGIALTVLASAARAGAPPAPPFQDTAYPIGTTEDLTENPATAYPAGNTPSPTSPGPTATVFSGLPTPTVTLAPGLLPSTTAPTLVTTSQTPANLYLTEAAQMAQSSGTPLPSETPTITPTPTLTPTPIPPAPPPYRLNWGAFVLGFFAALLLPSAGWIGYRYYQSRRNQGPML